jgi:CDP-glycerol glycerophosphotransferase
VNTPRIGVVVPFYNNADVLGDCLASIAAQTFRDLEVIMVDDGSTDDGASIAGERAAADPRFILVQVRGGGPGRARNLGIERASGEFLAFVDGDDMVPPHAYETLLHALESSGSDFASGAVQRIGTGGVHASALHERAIKGRKTGTHVTRSPRRLPGRVLRPGQPLPRHRPAAGTAQPARHAQAGLPPDPPAAGPAVARLPGLAA